MQRYGVRGGIERKAVLKTSYDMIFIHLLMAQHFQ